MHELSIVSGMLERIDKIKAEQNWQKITRIQMMLGPLSGVERYAIDSCFELLTEQWSTRPVLEIVIEPIEFHCNACQKVSLILNIELKCNDCSSTEGKIYGGRSLYFSEMEGE